VLGILSCLALISTVWATFVALIPYFAVGFFIYFSYGQFHSKLRNGFYNNMVAGDGGKVEPKAAGPVNILKDI
jgi:hypothetical protein